MKQFPGHCVLAASVMARQQNCQCFVPRNDRGAWGPSELGLEKLANPPGTTSDIASTRDIAMVWLAGVPVDRNRLLQKIKSLEQRTLMRELPSEIIAVPGCRYRRKPNYTFRIGTLDENLFLRRVLDVRLEERAR